MSENYPKALALHLNDLVKPNGYGGYVLDEGLIRTLLDDLGLKLVPLRGGPDPEGATASRHPGED